MSPAPAGTGNPRGKDLVAALVLLAVLLWAGWWGSRSWDNPGLSGHEFRQSQTALTVQAMQDDGFRLDYATPVLGKPWSIPMEFPLYQFAAVKFCAAFGVPINEGGRWVSALAFLLGLPAVAGLLRLAGFSRGASWIALGPIILAPVHLFYARTVMIESTAWAASAWFLWGVLHFRRSGRATSFAVALLAGIVAVLTKATTWAVFCLPWAVVFLIDLSHLGRSPQTTWRRLLAQALGIGIPLLAVGFAWVAYADAVKALNPMAHFLRSEELRDFNFGTWAERWTASSWIDLGKHLDQGIMPVGALAVLIALALVWSRTRRLAALGLVGFVGAPMIFFNLYVVHDYYFFGNAVFAAGIVGALLAAAWDARSAWWKSALPAALALLAVTAVEYRTYRNTLYALQIQPADAESSLFRAIDAVSQPNDVVVQHSAGWNSVTAYFTHRRMLIIPDSQMFFHEDLVRKNLANLADESVPLLVVVGRLTDQANWIADRVADMKLWPVPLFEWSDSHRVFARRDRYMQMRAILKADPSIDVRLPPPDPRLPVEQRQTLAGTPDGERIKSEVGIEPLYGVLPFGVIMQNDSAQGRILLAHAATELVFAVPPDASTVDLTYQVNPDSFNHNDFDGVAVLVDLTDDQTNDVGQLTPLAYNWILPSDQPHVNHVSLPLPSPRPNRLVLRVLPGPSNSNAFDQVWLGQVRFH